MWYLSKTAHRAQSGAPTGVYAWRKLHGSEAGAFPSLVPGALLPPPSPPNAPPPLVASGPTPGARCAHSAVPSANGMMVFGGRIPLVARARNPDDPTWQTLSDLWHFDVAAAEQSFGAGWSVLQLDAVSRSGTTQTNAEVNRSDHSAIMRRGTLMVFGGLQTDVRESTIYIMKDFLSLILPAAPFSSAAQLYRLDWGPDWRFDHTMVNAPRLSHPEGGRVEDAPLLFGGGGGMEIFGDLWMYDHASGSWVRVDDGAAEEGKTAVNVVTSLLFGTIGFGIYACVIVCAFVRRLTRRSRDLPGGPGLRPGAGPPTRMGVPPEMVAAMPRIKWCDVIKLPDGPVPTDKSASSGGDKEASGSKAADGDDDDNEEELCPVCLVGYEPEVCHGDAPPPAHVHGLSGRVAARLARVLRRPPLSHMHMHYALRSLTPSACAAARAAGHAAAAPM